MKHDPKTGRDPKSGGHDPKSGHKSGHDPETAPEPIRYRIGVDIGGTFTDFVLVDDRAGTAITHKQLTTPEDPSLAVVEGVAAIAAAGGVPVARIDAIVHGTTLVTNAIIERKGAATAMLVTRGFADVLDIAQERRYDLFDLRLVLPSPVVPRSRRIEVDGRLHHDGREETPLSLEPARPALERLVETDGIESVAVCLLHAYRDPRHEEAAAEWLARHFPALKVSTSSGVFPSIREYERWTTATLNAYVQPVVDRYLDRIETGLAELGFGGRFLVMSSSGGSLTAALARRFPIRLLESGPAAGALMSAAHGRALGEPDVLSFDMGGTTAKGCVIRGGVPQKRYEFEVGRVHEFKKGSGLPARIPVIDMIEIGAGGGSLVGFDDRGTLCVGPRSAGARPGPVCYGRGGTEPTLTDANLLLGYLDAGSFLGGRMALDVAATRAAMQARVADAIGVDARRAAWGVHEIINEDVARAFRVHASERGVDIRHSSMIVFGGSGPLHGSRVARKLRIPKVICPVGAGVMSAFGLLTSPIGFEVARSWRVDPAQLGPEALARALDALGDQAAALVVEAGVPRAAIVLRYALDVRYDGQGYEIEVPIPADLATGAVHRALPALFATGYRAVFGTDFPERSIEIVNWKAEASGPPPAGGRTHRLVTPGAAGDALKGRRDACFDSDGGLASCPGGDRYRRAGGPTHDGPAR
ncbi:MAG: hydantoinase/oxoprolinase family protein, partial [Lautropia sp.]